MIAGYPRRLGLIAWRRARDAAADALEALGGGIDPEAKVGELPAAERSLVAIARSLAVAADILVLDEPTAALPEHDVARLLEGCAACASAASPSSTSPTGSTRCSASPTGSRSCATAAAC